jgi:hypothetical protein
MRTTKGAPKYLQGAKKVFDRLCERSEAISPFDKSMNLLDCFGTSCLAMT